MHLIIIFICLGAIIYQDLKYRHLHILWPIIIFITGIYDLFTKFNSQNSIMLVITNGGFLLLTFVVLVGYMGLKNKGFENPFENYFGLGDLLFYIAVTPFFMLTNYVLFFIFSMIFSIMIYLVFKKLLDKNSIPLAGYASILLILFIVKDMLGISAPITLIQ